MSELKPCQMTADEAISALEMCQSLMLFDPMTGETHELWEENRDNQDLYNACSIAISALRRAQPANDPLTLEQLREMDGEPVWIDGGRFWALVCVCGQIVYLAENSGETVYAEKWMKHMGNIYRHPPEVCIGVDLASGHDFTAYGRKPEGELL